MGVFNNVTNIGNVLLDFALSGKDFFGYMDILNEASLDKINNRLNKQFQVEYSSLSVIESK